MHLLLGQLAKLVTPRRKAEPAHITATAKLPNTLQWCCCDLAGSDIRPSAVRHAAGFLTSLLLNFSYRVACNRREERSLTRTSTCKRRVATRSEAVTDSDDARGSARAVCKLSTQMQLASQLQMHANAIAAVELFAKSSTCHGSWFPNMISQISGQMSLLKGFCRYSR